MTDLNKNNLLYVPKTELERHYESSGIFYDKTPDLIKNTPIIENKTNIINDLNELKSLIDFLPDGLAFIKDSIDKLIELQEYHFNKDNNNEEDNDSNTPDDTNNETDNDIKVPNITPPDEIIDNSTNEEQNDINDDSNNNNNENNNINNDNNIDFTEDYEITNNELIDLPDFFPNKTNIDINFVEPKSLIQIAQEDYKRDTLDLNEYYLQKLQIVLQQYFQKMLAIGQECGVMNIKNLIKDFDGNAVNINDKNLLHLKDHVIRSQILRDQKTRLFKLTHNVDNTLNHIRSWHASEQERERYYSEEYGDSETYLNNCSNTLLVQSRKRYDNNYKQSLYNMFKYLDSSVLVTGEILSLVTNEAQAKGKMLKEGIDIFVSSKTKKAEELTKQTQVIESNMNKVQDNTNTTTNTNNDTTNNEQQKYDDFAKLQKEHPEWFVGDTYVGNDADAKKKAEEALKQNQDTKNKTNNIIKDVLNTVTSKNNDSIVNYFIESIKLKNNTKDKGGN
ncbi:Uncharacterised protein [Megamonas hypermegale]|uniref:Uncharacterized protein n=1 Tax=Megamonas hypermegale TaxID=158847 RepID=A0A378NSE1_9FIRM|nr:hypothetical protein [Megamonas hypermegale]STY71281.1 Uncharacterised protein [Megamonas hypermegale]